MPKRILVRSSINVDEFFEVDHIVLSGETIASTSYSRRAGGKGANCAAAIAKASKDQHAVDFCGTINSQDAWLRETLTTYGVGASQDTLRERDDLPTGRAIIQVSNATADNSIILIPGCNFAAYDLPEDLAAHYSHLLVQNEIPLEQTCEALRAAHQRGLVTLFNPSPVPSTHDIQNTIPWDCVEWLLVNEHEAQSLATALDIATIYPEIMDDLMDTLPALRGIVITLGPRGVGASIRLQDGGTKQFSSPAGRPQGPIIDTTGAGDTFAGYFAVNLMHAQVNLLRATEGEDRIPAPNLTGILAFASEAATACCEKNGAMEAIPVLDEVIARFKSIPA